MVVMEANEWMTTAILVGLSKVKGVRVGILVTSSKWAREGEQNEGGYKRCMRLDGWVCVAFEMADSKDGTETYNFGNLFIND